MSGYSFNPNGKDGYNAAPFHRNYQSDYRPDYQNRERVRRKHSGSKFGIDKNGNDYIRGWNYSKSRGMVSFFATAYKGTGEHVSKKSKRVYLNWMVKIQIQRTMETRIVSGLYEPATGKVTIPDLAMVMNPKTDYCGTYIKRKNR